MAELNKYQIMSMGTNAMLSTASKALKHKKNMEQIGNYDDFLKYITENFGNFEKEKFVEFEGENSSIWIRYDDDKNIHIVYRVHSDLKTQVFFKEALVIHSDDEEKIELDKLTEIIAKETTDAIDIDALAAKIQEKEQQRQTQ